MVTSLPSDMFGKLALDFVNTEHPGQPGADLVASEALLSWLAQSVEYKPAQGAAPRLPVLRTLAAEAHALRSEIRILFEYVASGTVIGPATLFALNRAMNFGGHSSRLVVVDGGVRIETMHDTDSPLALLAPIARCAAELVTHADPARLRECAAEECFRWFLDTSKGGRRRWCSMARCGNRSKAARYRAKQLSVD